MFSNTLLMDLTGYPEEYITEKLKQWTTGDFIQAYNEICEINNYYDSYIYNMADFNEMFTDTSPATLAKMIQYGDLNIYHEYFYFDGCGNIKTGNYYRFNTFTGEFSGDLPINYKTIINMVLQEGRPEK